MYRRAMKIVKSANGGAYDMPYAATGSAVRCGVGVTYHKSPTTLTLLDEGSRWSVAAGVQRRDDGGYGRDRRPDVCRPPI